MKPPTRLFAGLLLAVLPATGWALDYRSVAADKTLLYDAPSAQAKKLFIVSQFMPVEVIVNLGDWVKVRDKRGELAWIESARLAPLRTVQVTAAQAEVRESPDPAAAVVFRAEKDVVLELQEAAPSGWVRVRHRDGLRGYVAAPQVWGL
ncbi:MAG: hypothetical protein FGM62_08065 [Methylobacterium sp.]|nr:hypothetical protein [Methylobacterium sp.]